MLRSYTYIPLLAYEHFFGAYQILLCGTIFKWVYGWCQRVHLFIYYLFDYTVHLDKNIANNATISVKYCSHTYD